MIKRILPMKPLLKREDYYLLLIFIFMALGILTKSFFNDDGYITPDSAGYLALAQNLVEGNGFYVYSSYRPSNERSFFAVWPVGYPIFIYLVAKAFGISVFLASKIVNIIFIGISILLFRKLFKKNAYVYSLIFFAATFILIFTLTWSEVPFIFGLLWFSTAVYYFSQNTNSKLLIFNLFTSSLFLFLNRYIGAFSIGFIGMMSIFYLRKKDYKTSFKLILVSFVGFSIIALYLYHNYLKTGYFTGTVRLPAPETNFELLKMLIRALVIELNIIRTPGGRHITNTFKFSAWFVLQLGFFLYLFWKIKDYIHDINKNEEKYHLYKYFIFVGITYFFCIVLIRWYTNFIGFYCRLLGPASFLFFIAFVNYVEFKYSQKVFQKLKVFIVITCIVSYLLNVPLITIKMFLQSEEKTYQTYYGKISELKDLYSKIPQNSVVVFPNIHLYYLRTDIIGLAPFYPGLAGTKKESMQEFLIRINKIFPEKEVYFQIKDNKPYKDPYHKSIIEFVDNNQGKEFVKIK
ncbi:MAG: hypothetical protein SCARUB_03732 [Candidatus Scalindua rubra]|uniref:Glycosyltransferase RgtA/B/C/D-like domain-containing protein n=1 Tax=Candidatus Scalindua rubra TaxID=1872076 RepID=A0A1E3X6D1_9BACT|nr:MAG: hypothetical protein SCARUB_03732 [Candidatus Scalindua rubra]